MPQFHAAKLLKARHLLHHHFQRRAFHQIYELPLRLEAVLQMHWERRISAHADAGSEQRSPWTEREEVAMRHAG